MTSQRRRSDVSSRHRRLTSQGRRLELTVLRRHDVWRRRRWDQGTTSWRRRHDVEFLAGEARGLQGPASQGPRRPLHERPPVKSATAYNRIRITGTPLGVNGRHRMAEGGLEELEASGLQVPASQGPRRPLHERPPVKSAPAYNPAKRGPLTARLANDSFYNFLK